MLAKIQATTCLDVIFVFEQEPFVTVTRGSIFPSDREGKLRRQPPLRDTIPLEHCPKRTTRIFYMDKVLGVKKRFQFSVFQEKF
jgi:hypothetical protein